MRFGCLPGMPHGVQWLLNGEGTGGAGGSGSGGSGSGGSGGSGGDSGGERRQNPADYLTRYNNDAVRLASELCDSERSNFNLREKNRTLVTENDGLKAKLPGATHGEGALVLNKEQAAQWEGFQNLGLKPDEITAQLGAGSTAIAENTAFKRAATLDEAAKILSFKPGVLKLLAKDLNVELREVEVTDTEGNTSKQKRAYIVGKDGDKETLTGLQEYFRAQGEDVLATLVDDGQNYLSPNNSGTSGRTNGNINGSSHGGSNGGTPYPAQGGGGGGGKQGYTLRNRYEHNLPKDK